MSNDIKIVKKIELENGAVLTIYDESTVITGDRLIVKLRFLTAVPWLEWMDELILNEKMDVESIRLELNEISFEMIKERKFVDAKDKDEVIETLISETKTNIAGYLTQPSFTEKFFKKKLQNYKESLTAKPELSVLDDVIEEDDDPADFSDCFK